MSDWDNIRTEIETAQDGLDSAITKMAKLESETEKERLSLMKSNGNASGSTRKSKRVTSSKNVSKESICSSIMSLLRQLGDHGIEAIEHKSLSKNYAATDVLNKMVFAEIAKIGEPENEWDSTQRGTVFVKSSSA